MGFTKHFVVTLVLLLSCLLLAAVAVVAQGHEVDYQIATRADVLKLVKKAEDYYHSHSLGESVSAFRSGEYLKKDFYLFMLDNDGKSIVHAWEPFIEGQNLYEMTDSEGVKFVQKFIAVEDRSWISYTWRHPSTGELLQKHSYIVRLDDNYLIGGGYYDHIHK